MEKIIDVTALTDALKILLWDRSKSREELAKLVIGLIEEAGEEIVHCENCKHYQNGDIIHWEKFCFRLKDKDGNRIGYNRSPDDWCSRGERRDSDG